MRELEELGEPLAVGRTAVVYPWGETRVLKLFQPWMSLGAVESERRKAAAALAVGLPVPAVGDIVRFADRIGLVFERVDGASMMDQLRQQPDLVQSSARWLAQMQLLLHAREAPEDLPAQKDLLRERIARGQLLSRAEREAALDALAQMAADNRLCHGDFHPGNVLLARRGPVIIDWIDASRGHPVADVARTSLLFLGHLENTPVSAPEREAIELYHRTYLDHYLQMTSADRAEYQRWLPIMAAARLDEGIAEQQEWLLGQVRTGLLPE